MPMDRCFDYHTEKIRNQMLEANHSKQTVSYQELQSVVTLNYEKKILMVNNSTNINKTNNHLSPQIIEYKKDHDIWHPSEIQTQNVTWLNWLNPLLNGSPITIKYIHRLASIQKDSTLLTKINCNINMDSTITIAQSMNVLVYCIVSYSY